MSDSESETEAKSHPFLGSAHEPHKRGHSKSVTRKTASKAATETRKSRLAGVGQEKK
jgi:hypothetical protein